MHRATPSPNATGLTPPDTPWAPSLPTSRAEGSQSPPLRPQPREPLGFRGSSWDTALSPRLPLPEQGRVAGGRSHGLSNRHQHLHRTPEIACPPWCQSARNNACADGHRGFLRPSKSPVVSLPPLGSSRRLSHTHTGPSSPSTHTSRRVPESWPEKQQVQTAGSVEQEPLARAPTRSGSRAPRERPGRLCKRSSRAASRVSTLHCLSRPSAARPLLRTPPAHLHISRMYGLDTGLSPSGAVTAPEGARFADQAPVWGPRGSGRCPVAQCPTGTLYTPCLMPTVARSSWSATGPLCLPVAG